MKILVITPGALPFPPVNGGAVENLISLYINHNEKSHKHEYIVVSKYVKNIEKYQKKYKYTDLIYINEDSFIYKIKKIIRYIFRHFLKIRIDNAYEVEVLKKIKNINFDLIIVENEPAFIYKLRKVYPNKLIFLHLHNDYLNFNNNNSKEIIKKYDKIITVSNYLKGKILDIDSKVKVSTLYNATDIERFSKKIEQSKLKKIKDKYKIPLNKKIIMYVGRVQQEKGILELIQAFNKVSSANKYQLVIVGSSFFKNEKNDGFSKMIEKLIQDNSKNITLTGYVDYNDIHSIFSLADIGVVPSQCNEAFGMTLLEFMATGIPTIITNDGALPEIATDETSITIIKDKDLVSNLESAMIRLLSDDMQRKIMKKASIERAKKFNVSSYVMSLNKIIGE